MKARRKTPRRRDAPRWAPQDWTAATVALLARCKGNCEYCGEDLRGRGERHHRKRRRDGGDRLSNLVLLHPWCHQWMHAHPAMAITKGFIVRVIDDPLTQPFYSQNRRWAQPDDDGGLSPI